MESQDVSGSGSPVYRHGQRKRPFELAADADPESVERIEAHIEEHLGPITQVFNELISDLVHVELHHVGPTPDRDCHTFVTSGMSDLPMNVPEGSEDRRFAELLFALPRDWPVPAPGESVEVWNDDRASWPIRWLKLLAHFPHEYDTWLGVGHSMPNGNPPQPLAADLPFTGLVFLPPVISPPEFHELELVPGVKTVRFLAIVPVTTDEMELKLDRGLDALTRLFDEHEVDERFDPKRKSVVAR
jgi:hypothetical protein